MPRNPNTPKNPLPVCIFHIWGRRETRSGHTSFRKSKVIYSNTFSATLPLASWTPRLHGSMAPSAVVVPFAKFVPKLAKTCTKGQLSSFLWFVCASVPPGGQGIFLYAGQRRKIIIPDMANWTSERALCARHQRGIFAINRRAAPNRHGNGNLTMKLVRKMRWIVGGNSA